MICLIFLLVWEIVVLCSRLDSCAVTWWDLRPVTHQSVQSTIKDLVIKSCIFQKSGTKNAILTNCFWGLNINKSEFDLQGRWNKFYMKEKFLLYFSRWNWCPRERQTERDRQTERGRKRESERESFPGWTLPLLSRLSSVLCSWHSTPAPTTTWRSPRWRSSLVRSSPTIMSWRRSSGSKFNSIFVTLSRCHTVTLSHCHTVTLMTDT